MFSKIQELANKADSFELSIKKNPGNPTPYVELSAENLNGQNITKKMITMDDFQTALDDFLNTLLGLNARMGMTPVSTTEFVLRPVAAPVEFTMTKAFTLTPVKTPKVYSGFDYCPFCGEYVEGSGKFCSDCGKSLVIPEADASTTVVKYCPECGLEADESETIDDFCCEDCDYTY